MFLLLLTFHVECLLAAYALRNSSEAIIVSGGVDSVGDGKGEYLSSAELLHADGTPWCSLPDLPSVRVGHTHSGAEACGGREWEDGGSSAAMTRTSCVSLQGAGWVLTHVLQQARFYHSSWASPSGQVLLGGYVGGPHGSSSNTSELLSTSTMDSADHFPLKYGITAEACAIEMPDYVVVTGGAHDTRSKVTVYSEQGWVQDLPSLIQGRAEHACGHYVHNDIVVYLVVGGGAYDLTGQHTIVATTEILHEGGDSWTQVGSLPQAFIGLKAVSINNGIIATAVYRFDPEWLEWTQVAEMQQPRSYHGMGVVSVADMQHHCH